MQEKPKNKLQLEDYFQAAANRKSMFRNDEVEQLISSDKKPLKTGYSKSNILKILTIMTLITFTIAALIFMINPYPEKIVSQKTEIIMPGKDAKKSQIKIKNRNENSISESKKTERIFQSNSVLNSNKKEKQTAQNENDKEEDESKRDDKNVVVNPFSGTENEKQKNQSNYSSEQPKSATEIIKDDKQIKLEGIHLLELTREELLQLGFRISGDSVFTRTNGHYTFGYSMNGTILKIHSMDANGKKIKPKKVKFINPDLVTDDLGNWRSYTDKRPEKVREFKFSGVGSENKNEKVREFKLNKIEPANNSKSDSSKPQYTLSEIRKVKDEKTGKKIEIEVPYNELQKEGEQRILDKVNTFIPILIRTGVPYTIEDSINKRHRPDLIVWYEVTDDFLKTLPKELRKKIENEYYQITKQPEKLEKNSTSTNCEYFEVCRSTLKSASDVVVFPNPAIESATMRFNLKEDASLRVNLYDISGRLVKELKSFSQLEKGQHELPLNLDGITEGMYLIVLESEKGETNIQRLVKGKN